MAAPLGIPFGDPQIKQVGRDKPFTGQISYRSFHSSYPHKNSSTHTPHSSSVRLLTRVFPSESSSSSTSFPVRSIARILRRISASSAETMAFLSFLTAALFCIKITPSHLKFSAACRLSGVNSCEHTPTVCSKRKQRNHLYIGLGIGTVSHLSFATGSPSFRQAGKIAL